MTADVNVLVAASRSDHPHHEVAHDWLVQALAAATVYLGEQLARFDRDFRRLIDRSQFVWLKPQAR